MFNQNTSPICKHCNDQVIEDLPHALISCSYNREIPQSLMDTVGLSQPISIMSKVLTLDFEMEEKMEFPLVWLISNLLQKVWDIRKQKKKRCDLVRVRADLEARVSLLRKTRYSESATIITQLLSNM